MQCFCKKNDSRKEHVLGMAMFVGSHCRLCKVRCGLFNDIILGTLDHLEWYLHSSLYITRIIHFVRCNLQQTRHIVLNVSKNCHSARMKALTIKFIAVPEDIFRAFVQCYAHSNEQLTFIFVVLCNE